MAKKREMQDAEYEEEREAKVSGRKPVTIEDLIRKDRTRLAVSSVFEVILILMELYVIFNMGEELMIIAIGIVPIAALLYLIVSSAVDISQLSKQQDEEKYEELYRAQKASYIVIRRSFEELQQRMDEMEDVSSLPTSQIIGAQKAVAKVTISRNKENADALLNSNDMLVERLANMEEKFEDSSQKLMDRQTDILNGTKEELLKKNQELLLKNQELEGHISTLKATISGIESKVNALESKTAQPSVIINQAPTTALSENQLPSGQGRYVSKTVEYTKDMSNEMLDTEEETDISEDFALQFDSEMDADNEDGMDQDISLRELDPIEEENADADNALEVNEPDLDETDLDETDLDETDLDEINLDESDMEESEENTEEPVYETPTEESIEDLATMAGSIEEDIDISELDPELEAVLNSIAEEPSLEEIAAEDTAEISLEGVAEETGDISLEEMEEESAEIPLEEMEEESAEIPLEEIEEESVEISLEEIEEEPVDKPLEEMDETPAVEKTVEEVSIEETPMDETPAVETLAEEAPVEEVPVEEEAAGNVGDALAGLDTSDPNKVMSPDEIQALFAKL